MLGLATAGRGMFETSFVSFSENGLCREFLGRAADGGFPAIELANDTPRLLQAVREIQQLIRDQGIDVLLCHGYKAGLVGWRAARRAGIPVTAVSRGWTGENRKVRFYEWLDRKILRYMDRVICVSQAQAAKVLRCGVRADRIVVIPNAIDTRRFDHPDPAGRRRLEEMFPAPPQAIVGAAGRLSPEKGFDILIEAARAVIDKEPHVGFVLFGEGPLRESLAEQIALCGVHKHFVLAGFCSNLDSLLSHLDLFVQSSHTEGMPNVVLESLAAGIPVVATAVGGTAEVVEHDATGDLVPAGSADFLARALIDLVRDSGRRERYSRMGRSAIAGRFGFENQAAQYCQLFGELLSHRRPLMSAAHESETGLEVDSQSAELGSFRA